MIKTRSTSILLWDTVFVQFGANLHELIHRQDNLVRRRTAWWRTAWRRWTAWLRRAGLRRAWCRTAASIHRVANLHELLECQRASALLDLGSLFSRGLLFMDVRASALLHRGFILLFLLFHGFDSDLEQVSIVLDLSVLHNFWFVCL